MSKKSKNNKQKNLKKKRIRKFIRKNSDVDILDSFVNTTPVSVTDSYRRSNDCDANICDNDAVNDKLNNSDSEADDQNNEDDEISDIQFQVLADP